MLKHILVAVDFSQAWPRLRTRLQQLSGLGCRRVTLAHVLASGYTQAPELAHREHYEHKLAAAAEALRDESGLEVDWTVRVGSVPHELLAAAREYDADAILAGSQGCGRLHQWMLGSSVLDLARVSDRPLLVVPMGADDDAGIPGAGCRPLLATDGSDAASGAEDAFLRLLPDCGRGVVVAVGDWDDDPEAEAERERVEAHIAALAERAGDDAFDVELPGSGRPSEGIARVAREREADMIVIGRRGRNPMAELLLGSTAEAVCRGAGRVVLLIPASDQPAG